MKQKKKSKYIPPIPEHSDEALEEIDRGGLYFDYANYEGNHIVAYKRWGRGYMKCIVERETDG